MRSMSRRAGTETMDRLIRISSGKLESMCRVHSLCANTLIRRKPAYLKKLKYFCDNHSATDSDPPCVEVYNYNEKAN